MMQTANTRQGDDTASCAGALLDQPLARRLFRQTKMRPVLVIIADEVIHEGLQMAFVEHDHMIKQFATAAANEPFRNAILPGTSETGPFRSDTEALYGIDDVGVEVRCPIKDQGYRRGMLHATAATPMRSSGAAWH